MNLQLYEYLKDRTLDWLLEDLNTTWLISKYLPYAIKDKKIELNNYSEKVLEKIIPDRYNLKNHKSRDVLYFKLACLSELGFNVNNNRVYEIIKVITEEIKETEKNQIINNELAICNILQILISIIEMGYHDDNIMSIIDKIVNGIFQNNFAVKCNYSDKLNIIKYIFFNTKIQSNDNTMINCLLVKYLAIKLFVLLKINNLYDIETEVITNLIIKLIKNEKTNNCIIYPIDDKNLLSYPIFLNYDIVNLLELASKMNLIDNVNIIKLFNLCMLKQENGRFKLEIKRKNDFHKILKLKSRKNEYDRLVTFRVLRMVHSFLEN